MEMQDDTKLVFGLQTQRLEQHSLVVPILPIAEQNWLQNCDN
jgi:hypothetical protein